MERGPFHLLPPRLFNVYNIQDVIILGVILENKWQKMKDATVFDPRCFTSASTLSGAIERVKSKVIITLPKDVETVELMESLLSGVILLSIQGWISTQIFLL